MSAVEDATAGAGKAGGSAVSGWNVGTGRLSGGSRSARAKSETLASAAAKEADDEGDGGAWNTGRSGVKDWDVGGSSLSSAATRSAPRKMPAGRERSRRRSVAEGTLSLNVAEFLQGMDGSASTRALHDSGLFGNLGDSALFGDLSDSDSSLEKFDDSLSSLPFISPSFARIGAAKSVRDLVERRKWMKLLKLLQTPEGREQVRASCGGGAAASSGDEEEKLEDKSHDYATYDGTALHHAVSRGAPLKVVRAVVSAGGPALWPGDAPKAEAEGGKWPVLDSGGRTALHAAAASTTYNPEGVNGGAVVAYLIGLVANSAVVPAADVRGRSPLHLACINRPDGQAKRRKLSPSVIRALVDAAPSAVRMEDGSGLTPLDYAVASVTGLDGKFCPEGKTSLTVLSEPAIFPMVRHCHGLWSERAAARSAAKAGMGDEGAGVCEYRGDGQAPSSPS